MDAHDLYPTQGSGEAAPVAQQDSISTQFTLNLDKVGVTQAIPSGLHRLKYEEEPGFFYDGMLARLTAYVLSEHLAADTVEDSDWVPLAWWDHLKHDALGWARKKPCRVLTRYWIRKRPVRYEEITLTTTWTRKATRPMSKIRFAEDRLGPVVYQEQVSHSLWSSNETAGN